MKKFLLTLGIVFCMWKFAHAQTTFIPIPGSSFPQVSMPSNDMRFMMVYPKGGLSLNPLNASNATISYANLVASLRLVIGGGGGGSASNAFMFASTNGVPIMIGGTNLNFIHFFVAPSSNSGTLTIDMGSVSVSNLVSGVSNILANLSGGFHILITNGSSSAQIQAAFNSATKGAVIEFQPGAPFNITSTISITNSLVILGNGSTITNPPTMTNFVFDTGTNYQKSLVIENLRFDGGYYPDYTTSNNFHLEHRGAGIDDPNPYFNTGWSNRTALRAEVSQGVLIDNCYFYGWSGNGALFTSVSQLNQYQTPKLLFVHNHLYTNFCGVTLANTTEDTQGYYNNSISGQAAWTCEYALVSENDMFRNYVSLNASPGNVVVNNNFLDANFIGLLHCSQSGNSAHGRYNNNSFNHNTGYAIYAFLQPEGGMYENNFFGRNGQALQPPNNTNIYYPNFSSSGVHFDNVQGIMFVNNKLSREYMTFTNGCNGVIAHNTYGTLNINGAQGGTLDDSNLVWGANPPTTAGVPTNFQGSIVQVWDNRENLGIRHDGSMGSILAISTNPPVAGGFAMTPNATNASWVVLPSPTNLVVFDWSGFPSDTNIGYAAIFTGMTAAGNIKVHGVPTNGFGGGGGGSSFPLSGDVSAAFHSIYNFNVTGWTNTSTGVGVFAVASLDSPNAALTFTGSTNNIAASKVTIITDNLLANTSVRSPALNGTTVNATNLIVGSYNPLQGPWRAAFMGDSITAGTFISGASFPFWITNVFLPNAFTFTTNAARSGDTINFQESIYTNSVAVFKPSGGTNGIAFWYCGVNDINNGNSAAQVINDWSNAVWVIRNDGWDVVTSTIMPESAWLNQDSTMQILQQVNEFILTNNMTRVVLRADLYFNPIVKFTIDGTHPTTNTHAVWASKIVDALRRPYRFVDLGGYGVSANYLNVASETYSLERGWGVLGHMIGPFAMLRFSESGAASSSFGSYNGLATIRNAPGTGNETIAATFGQTVATMANQITAPGIATLGGVASTTNSAVASTSVTFPATTVPWTNTFGVNIVLYIDNSGITGTLIKKNGQQVFSSVVGDTSLLLKPGDFFSETYTIGTPVARWEQL